MEEGIYVKFETNKGDILITMGKIEEGIVWVTKAIELRPNWPLYYCNRVK